MNPLEQLYYMLTTLESEYSYNVTGNMIINRLEVFDVTGTKKNSVLTK